MANRKDLLEQYEDAQFALLMDQLMEMEGAEQEERKQQLKREPEAAVPREVRERSMETIRNAYDELEQKKKVRQIKNTFRTILIAAAVATLLLTGVSADFRLVARNFVYELTELAAELMFDFGDDRTEENKGEMIMGYYIPALPKEFELVDKSDNVNSAWRQYRNTNGFVMINISNDDGDGFDYHIDVENLETNQERINQFDVLIIESENRVQFVLSDKETQKHIEITSNTMSVQEIRNFISRIK